MKIITRQLLAEHAPTRFEAAYMKSREEWTWKRPYTKGQMIDLLKALPSPVDPDEVDRIIGNDSWTSIQCHECGDNHPSAVVEIGQVQDYESATACICLKCLNGAVQMLEEQQ